jgi:hypothetical protein
MSASPPDAGLQPAVVVPDTPLLGPFSASKAAESAIPTTSLSQTANPKFVSPSPGPASTITPPPSSQVPSQKQVLRTPSPVPSQLTSPPPTNRSVNLHHTSQHVVLSDLPTPEQVNMASMEQLRGMVEQLSLAVRDARTSAAHFKLQHNMLILDSQKATERMNVELEMTQREVEVLQESEERRRMDSHGSAQMTANAALITDLNRHCQLLQSENEEFRDVLARATRDLEDKDGQLLTLKEENQRLRHRIRQNREHMNGLLDSVSDGSPRSLLGTPHRTPHHTTTPRHIATGRAPMMQSSQGREPGAFDALLLADRVLNSQETATAPSTPKTQPLRHRMGHTRNTHSLSSLPSTPSRRPFNVTGSVLRTPPHLTAIQEPPSVGQPLPPHFALVAATRRRASSDSTITASSVDEREGELSGSDDEDAIPESQASQVATSMLRRTPSSSQQKQARLTQSRIIGKVTKSSATLNRVTDMEKRRLTSYGNEQGSLQGSPSKKSRHEGVGLGIGLPGRAE